MRARSANAGLARENRVVAQLVGWGWTCASRRHYGGAGDILAVRWLAEPADATDPLGDADLIIVEVKSTRRPYDHFLPEDRRAMHALAAATMAEAWLAWWPARGALHWIHESAWPKARPDVETQPQLPLE